MIAELKLCWPWIAYHVLVHILPVPHIYPDWRRGLVAWAEAQLLEPAGMWAYRHMPDVK